ncbi:MAG: cytochrome c peroxidase, partial [Bacteroidota bacterium]
MKRKLLPLALLITLFFNACQDDNTFLTDFDDQLAQNLRLIGGTDWRGQFTLPASDNYSAIPQDPLNPITAEKVALGQLLYHETGIGTAPEDNKGMATFSCASCHFAEAGFQAGRWQGIGEGGMGLGANGAARIKDPDYTIADIDVQPVRTPTALNVAYQRVMLWNGQFGATGPNNGTEAFWTPNTPKAVNHLGYEGVEIQAIAGQAVHRLEIDTNFLKQYNYMGMFDAAFPNFSRENRYTAETAGLAIAAYERTLLPNQAPFQRWLKGEAAAMSDLEKQGGALFFGKAQCAPCHGGPALSSEAFHAFGMNDLSQNEQETFKTPDNDPSNLGRGSFTGRVEDNYKFKVPQLYNLHDSPFYGHGASFTSIKDVVDYKNRGEKQNERVPNGVLSGQFRSLGLTDMEVDAISAFLENALRDDQLTRYLPPNLPSGNC